MDSSKAVRSKNVITRASCSTDNIPEGKGGTESSEVYTAADSKRLSSVATHTNADTQMFQTNLT